MIFTSSVQLRTIARNNIGVEVASTAVNWNQVFISIVISPKYESKPNLSIDSAIEVISAIKSLPQILKDRTNQYRGDLECKISETWSKILLIDYVKSPKSNIEFIKLVVNNQSRGSA